MILSDIPDIYLSRINNVNLPSHKIGMTNVFAVKKSMTSHFEIGYQLEYMNIQGNVKQEDVLYRVKTQALGNSFLLLYNLRKTDRYKPPFNYFIYYKIGAVTLKNTPREIVAEGQFPTKFIPANNDQYIKNIAVMTGLGLGLNHQLSDHINLTGAFEINRNSDNGGDIYKPFKLFYNSKNTVNNYISLSFGLTYSFNLTKQKKSGIFNSRAVMEYKLFLYRKKVAKKKSSKPRYSTWYNK